VRKVIKLKKSYIKPNKRIEKEERGRRKREKKETHR